MSNNEEDQNHFLPADHPHMAPMQAAMTQQLTQEHQRVDLELIDMEQTKRKLDQEKEEIGVRLYSVQQQLADNQVNYETAIDNYKLVSSLRLEAEQKLEEQQKLLDKKKAEVDELIQKYFKSQKELSKLTRTLYDIEQYNEQMGRRIQHTKRTTETADLNVGQLESQKKKQDFLIDQMNEEIKRLNEQKTILTAQLISQKEETESAKKILKDAQHEMQKIVASKKNLIERWQKSLVTMQKMDFALQSIKKAYNQQVELHIQIKTETSGVNNEIKKQEWEGQDLNEKLDRMVLRTDHLNQQKEKYVDKKNKREAKLGLLQKSLQTTELQVEKRNLEEKQIKEQMSLIESNIMKLHTETKKLYEDLINKKSEHTTIDKTTMNLNKQIMQLNIEIEEKNVENEDQLNELARINIDIMNTQTEIDNLEKKKKIVIKEKQEKEITVCTYDVQIKQGHDLNEKKQHEVGRLNKEHDNYVRKHLDPSERSKEGAELAKLKREIKELDDTKENLQSEWIKKQRQLVHQTNIYESNEDQVQQLQTKQTILEQKKLRLNQEYRQHEKEIKEIKNDLKNLQNEMNKLNDALYYNEEKHLKLTNENINIKSEFQEKLKELEKENVKIEVEIDILNEKKADLLGEITECERQILHWERQITLEREMQLHLDPNVGQKEIQDLKKEIHNMELRLEGLRKKKEEIQHMQVRTIEQEGQIMQKNHMLTSKSKQNQKTNEVLKRKQETDTMRTTLNTAIQRTQKFQQAIQQTNEDIEQIQQSIEQKNQESNECQQELEQREKELNLLKIKKELNLFEIKSRQNEAQKNLQIKNKVATSKYNKNTVQQKLDEQDQKLAQTYMALSQVLNEYPQHFDSLSIIQESIKQNINNVEILQQYELQDQQEFQQGEVEEDQ